MRQNRVELSRLLGIGLGVAAFASSSFGHGMAAGACVVLAALAFGAAWYTSRHG